MNSLRRLPAALACLAALSLSWAFANVSVEGDLTRLFDAEPGAVVEDELTLRNASDTDAHVRVYLTDYTFDADGSSAYPEPGTLERSSAAWVKLSFVPALVPAGESVTLPYRVEVPSAAGAGSFWSVIMVEEVRPSQHQGGALSLTTVVRYGVQVVATVGSAPAELRFTNPDFSKVSGSSVLTVDVENTGQVSLRAEYYLDLFDANGASLGRFQGTARRAHPGTSVRQRFELGELAPGTYLAIAIGDGGGESVFGAQYSLTVNQ